MTSNHDDNQDIDFDPFSPEQPPTQYDYTADERAMAELISSVVNQDPDELLFVELQRELTRQRHLYRQIHGCLPEECDNVYFEMKEAFVNAISVSKRHRALMRDVLPKYGIKLRQI